MADARISAIKAREILDSKARPMVEVDVWTTDEMAGRGASPCGTSVGSHEAFILRDGGLRYGGLGVQKAVRHVNESITPALLGRSVYDQRGIDQLMIDLDGTPDKSRLGANAIYSVSIAVARAAANSMRLPLFRYLDDKKEYILPVPMFNMINGKGVSETFSEFQEYLIIPVTAETYSEALRMGVEVFSKLGDVIKERYGRSALQIGTSAGFAAPTGEPAEILETLLAAAEKAGYGGKCKVGLDCAASDFYDRKDGRYLFQKKKITPQELIRILESLARSYPLFMIEDPLDEDDFEGFAEITKRVNLFVIGDDLFVTNLERLKRGVAMRAANAMILKPNMVGTLSEAMDTAAYAKEHSYCLVGSGRAGGMADDPIPDIAVAVGAPLVKFGAPRSGERIAKQNILLRIEEELGASGRFAGPDLFKATFK
jgi:enolase